MQILLLLIFLCVANALCISNDTVFIDHSGFDAGTIGVSSQHVLLEDRGDLGVLFVNTAQDSIYYIRRAATTTWIKLPELVSNVVGTIDSLSGNNVFGVPTAVFLWNNSNHIGLAFWDNVTCSWSFDTKLISAPNASVSYRSPQIEQIGGLGEVGLSYVLRNVDVDHLLYARAASLRKLQTWELFESPIEVNKVTFVSEGWPSIKLAPIDDRPAILYRSGDTKGLFYAERDPRQTWDLFTVVPSGDNDTDTSFALVDRYPDQYNVDLAAVLYYDLQNADLHFVTSNTSGWIAPHERIGGITTLQTSVNLHKFNDTFIAVHADKYPSGTLVRVSVRSDSSWFQITLFSHNKTSSPTIQSTMVRGMPIISVYFSGDSTYTFWELNHTCTNLPYIPPMAGSYCVAYTCLNLSRTCDVVPKAHFEIGRTCNSRITECPTAPGTTNLSRLEMATMLGVVIAGIVMGLSSLFIFVILFIRIPGMEKKRK